MQVRLIDCNAAERYVSSGCPFSPMSHATHKAVYSRKKGKSSTECMQEEKKDKFIRRVPEWKNVSICLLEFNKTLLWGSLLSCIIFFFINLVLIAGTREYWVFSVHPPGKKSTQKVVHALFTTGIYETKRWDVWWGRGLWLEVLCNLRDQGLRGRWICEGFWGESTPRMTTRSARTGRKAYFFIEKFRKTT